MNGFNVNPLGGFSFGQAMQGLGQALESRRQREQQSQMQDLIKRAVAGDSEAIPELYATNPQLGAALEQRIYQKAQADTAQKQALVKEKTAEVIRRFLSLPVEQRQGYLQSVSQDPQYAVVSADDELLKLDPATQEAEAKMAAYGLFGKDFYEQFVGVKPQAPEYSNVKVTEDGRMMGLNKRTGKFELIDAPAKVREAAPQVQVGAGETAEEKEVGSFRGKSYASTQTAAQAAARQMQNLNALEKLSPDSFSGFGADAFKTIAKIGKSLGIETEGLEETEVFEAVANNLVLDKAQSLSGALSDKDIAFLQATVPQLSQTSEGRKKLISLLKAVNQRVIDYGKEAAKYRRDKGTFDILGFQEMLSEKYGGKDFLADFYPTEAPNGSDLSTMSTEELMKIAFGGRQ